MKIKEVKIDYEKRETLEKEANRLYDKFKIYKKFIFGYTASELDWGKEHTGLVDRWLCLEYKTVAFVNLWEKGTPFLPFIEKTFSYIKLTINEIIKEVTYLSEKSGGAFEKGKKREANYKKLKEKLDKEAGYLMKWAAGHNEE